MPEAALEEQTLNGRHAPTRTARVVGLGHRLPDRVVPNGPIAERIGVDSDWIVRRTGIRERRYAAPDERTTDLALAAARRALSDAGLKASDIDLVLVATMTPDELTPNTAPRVADALRQTGAAFDVGSACTGWLSALSVGAGQIETGRAQNVLVIGAETLSRITNPDDKRTASLFGDGAGAVVLSPEGDGAVGPIVLASDGSMGDTITATHDDRLLIMDGHTTFNMAVKVLSDSTADAVARAGLTLDDIDLFASTTRPTGASSSRSARSSACRRSASPTTSGRPATRPPRRSRSPSACCARTAACGRARSCCWPPSAPASRGARASSSGRCARWPAPRTPSRS
jgi:3-oxoacyl-[acyl-carrier-protein] synthase-3